MRNTPLWVRLSSLAVYAFLYLPLIIVVIYSFNNSKLNAEWVGFTFKWYETLFNDGPMLIAARNSLLIGVVSSPQRVGFHAAMAAHRFPPGLGFPRPPWPFW